MKKQRPIKEIETIIYSYAYDELSDYGKAVRDFCNYLNKTEEITQKDIVEQVVLLQE